MKEIRRQIKEKEFYNVYLLVGDEDYLISQAKNLLKNALVREGDEMNCTVVENTRIDFQELAETAGTFPFFAEKRVLILDRTGVIKLGKDIFLDILKSLPDTTVVIICENKVEKNLRTYKWIKKNQYVGEFLKKDQTERTLLRWIAAMLGKEKKQIRESDARYFLERVGNDMFQISNEISKLIAYTGERAEISREDIDSITIGEVHNKIFDLITFISAKDKEKALACYSDLLILKEPPLRILFLVLRQYRNLVTIYTMKNDRQSDAQIAKVAGIPPFAVRRNASQLRGYTLKELEDSIEYCLRAEEGIKTGRIQEQIAVEALIMELMESRG